MAELLIRVRDKDGHNAMLLGEHEVVVVCDDNWPWSEKERTSPDHRIVRVSDPKKDAIRFSGQEASMDPDYHVVRRRHFKLDPSKFWPEFAAWYADDSRSVLIFDVQNLDIMLRERKPLPRRDVIGKPPGI